MLPGHHGGDVLMHHKKWRKKIVLVKTTKPYSVQSLPDLPEIITIPGIFRTKTHLYIFGGWRFSKYIYIPYKSKVMIRLCLQSNQWETCPPMLYCAVTPATVMQEKYLYVFGSAVGYSKKAQRYHLESEEWSCIKDLPHSMHRYTARAVVFEGRITIATRKHMMQYDQAKDEWIVNTFKDLQSRPLLTVLEGQLCASVGRGGIFEKKVYDEQENEWVDNDVEDPVCEEQRIN